MTLAATPRKAGPFAGNGVTTAFAFTFQTIAKSDLLVLRKDANGAVSTLVLDSDYTVTLNANQETSPGGTVTYPRVGSPMPTGETLTISTDEEEAQTTELTLGGGFSPTTVEGAFDRVTRLVQQLSEKVGRAVKASVVDSSTLGDLPPVALRAGKFMAFDANGNPTVSAGSGGGDTSLRTDLANGTSGPGSDLVAIKRTAAEIAAGVTPTSYQYEPGDVRRYGQGASETAATNKTALSNAISANDDIDVWPGTYDPLTISSSHKRITFRPGVTIKLPNGTVTAGATSGPAVLGIAGNNVTLVGGFTIDGNRANNNSGSFPTSVLTGSLHISGDNCRIEGEVFITGAYWRGFAVENGSSSGDEVDQLYIKKLRVYDPAYYSVFVWCVQDWQIDEIEVDRGTTSGWNARVRVGTQTTSTGDAKRGHIGSVRTNGAFVTESGCIDVQVDSVQCAGGKLQESLRTNIGLWTADGSLMASNAEAGPSFGMLICEDCHVGIAVVDGHYQTGADATAFTQGNVRCSVGVLSVDGTASAVDDCVIVLNTDLTIGTMKLTGTSTGGDGLFFDYDANSNNIYIGALHSTGHSNAGMFDVLMDSNLGSNTPIIIGSINEDATRSIGSGHRKDSFSWTSGTASQTVTNSHCRSTSRVRVIPRDADAAVIMHNQGYYITPGAGSFQIFTGTGGNTAAQSEWDYEIDNGL